MNTKQLVREGGMRFLKHDCSLQHRRVGAVDGRGHETMLACLHYLWLSVGRRNSIYDSGLNVNYKMEGYIMIQMWVVSASAFCFASKARRGNDQ